MHVLTPVLVPRASPGHGRQNKRKPRGSRGFSHAPKRTRTSTGHSAHKALNLARLPIPPPAQVGPRRVSRRDAEYSPQLIPSGPPATFSNTCSYHPPKTAREPAHGPDEAPAGDLRLHQALLGEVRLSADRSGHRQGRGPRVFVDRACPPRQPRAARAAAPRSDEAARDRAARPRARRRRRRGGNGGGERAEPRAAGPSTRGPGRRR